MVPSAQAPLPATSAATATEARGRAPALSPLVAAHVYRIGSEAMTNALRHADATGSTSRSRPSTGVSGCACATTAAGCRDERRPGPAACSRWRVAPRRSADASSSRPRRRGRDHGRPRSPPRPTRRYHVIRVAVIDDHPALRAGLQTVLDASRTSCSSAGATAPRRASGRCSTASGPTSCCSTTTCRAVTGSNSATASSRTCPRPGSSSSRRTRARRSPCPPRSPAPTGCSPRAPARATSSPPSASCTRASRLLPPISAKVLEEAIGGPPRRRPRAGRDAARRRLRDRGGSDAQGAAARCPPFGPAHPQRAAARRSPAARGVASAIRPGSQEAAPEQQCRLHRRVGDPRAAEEPAMPWPPLRTPGRARRDDRPVRSRLLDLAELVHALAVELRVEAMMTSAARSAARASGASS